MWSTLSVNYIKNQSVHHQYYVIHWVQMICLHFCVLDSYTVCLSCHLKKSVVACLFFLPQNLKDLRNHVASLYLHTVKYIAHLLLKLRSP